jgi:predicted acylesterase/phospholipase RssA
MIRLADRVARVLPSGPPRPPIASCLGAGGAFGIGFEMGVVAALLESGIPVDRGPMLGTSAGAWTAAAVAVGIGYEELYTLPDGPSPPDERVRVIDIARSVFGDRRDDRVTGMAMQLPFGVRRSLSGRRYELADIVAASSSPLKVTEPHQLEGRRYIDAGITRCTSVDRAASARLLVVVTPIAGRVLGRLGRVHEQVTRYEMHKWRLRTGGIVLFIRPTRHIAELVGDGGLRAILEVEAGHRAYEPAYELGLRCAERFRRRHPGVAEDLRAAS